MEPCPAWERKIDASYSGAGARQDEQLIRKECAMVFAFPIRIDGNDGCSTAFSSAITEDETTAAYHRPRMVCCCIRAGDTDGGGLAMEMPVDGLMIGMALPRLRAAGWCNLSPELWLWNEGGMKAGEVELSEKGGATEFSCCVGDDSGDRLARDDRSDEAIDTICSPCD